MKSIMDLRGIGPHLASKLAEMGISTIEQFVATPSEKLLEIPGLGMRRIETLLEVASQIAGPPKEPPVAQEKPVQATTPKSSQGSETNAEAATGPILAKKTTKKANKKKASDGKDSKKAKAKNKSKDKKKASIKKSKAKAAAAKRVADKKAKKAAAKKKKRKKKAKKSRKAKKK